MKKAICFILLFCFFALFITSCQKNDNCTITGIHKYEYGKCTGCENKVFDILKNYIIENAHTASGNRYLYYCGFYSKDDIFTIWEYNKRTDNITILARYTNNSHTFSTDIFLSSDCFESGIYEWESNCITLNCDCLSLYGFLNPSEFSGFNKKLLFFSSEQNADYMAKKYGTVLHLNIKKRIIPFLEVVGHDITISDLGFKNY